MSSSNPLRDLERQREPWRFAPDSLQCAGLGEMGPLDAATMRQRAKECRHIAELMVSQSAKAELFRMADIYDHLANEAEKKITLVPDEI